MTRPARSARSARSPRAVVAAVGVVLVAALALTARAAGQGTGVVSTDAGALPEASVGSAVAAGEPVVLRRTSGSTRPVPDPGWLARTAASSGVPLRALASYAGAALVEQAADKGCHLGWNTLAGIGWVESQHGTLGGRTLEPSGRSDRPVVGPALDGAGFAALAPSARGTALHGDPRWDHAVGPLQFLPGTWDRWGSDGDGDGTADPFDLDDAALAAARYLCADGHDLATPTGWTGAVLSYNHDRDYVVAVLGAADAYARGRSRSG